LSHVSFYRTAEVPTIFDAIRAWQNRGKYVLLFDDGTIGTTDPRRLWLETASTSDARSGATEVLPAA
jgi:hypothetical protein